MSLSHSLAVSVVFSLCASAFAVDEIKPQEKRAKGEWVLVPYGGQSKTQGSSLTVSQPSSNTNLTYQHVDWYDKSYAGPIYYGFKAIYWPSPEATFGLGIDFVHYKVYADVQNETTVSGTLNGNPYNQTEPITNTLQRFSISHGINLVTATANFRKPLLISEDFPSGRFQPYGGVGLGMVINHPENRFLGSPLRQKYQDGGFGWQLYVGGEYRITKQLGLFAEFKYTDYKPTVDMDAGGEGTTRLRTRHIAFGTTIRL